ncbi:MAG: hypothetical protein COB24_08920 [Hyphomicrobiales bacterium]|nr:MAG: hypothetical protein COB24_08920 [Hyphomicrobiales bacterium]
MKSVGMDVKIKFDGVDLKSIRDVKLPKFTKVEKHKISIADLLVWAIRDWGVLEWINAEHERIGGMKSQLGALIAQCELGGRVDGGGGVATDLPIDALRVGIAVQGLGLHGRVVVTDCAKHDQEPYKVVQKWHHVNAQDEIVTPIYDRYGKRKMVSRIYENVGGVRKQVRIKVCRIKPVHSDHFMAMMQSDYDRWCADLKLLTVQLSDLERFIIV